jgi:acyl-coenzyme A synthetase/AMP-(fatty) acid ligase
VRPGSSGKVLPGYEAKIVDDRGQPLPAGEIGDLLIRGESLFSHYWNQPEKTRAAFTRDLHHAERSAGAGDAMENPSDPEQGDGLEHGHTNRPGKHDRDTRTATDRAGGHGYGEYDHAEPDSTEHGPTDRRWFRTGDKYYQDSDGYLWFAGRSGDLFKVSGSWVSPAEVEGALARHPAVRECAVVAHADRDNLLRPAAFVVLNPDCFTAACPDHAALERELRSFLCGPLAGFKHPHWYTFVDDLPKTATGKLQRYKLR